MTSVTPSPIEDRDSAVSGVYESWVRATRAFATAGVYPVETGISGVRLDRVTHSMLRELTQGGPRRLGDLALASNLGVSHASRLVEGLVREGLVERTIPADDRRVTILDVSRTGRRVCEKVERQFLGLIADRLSDFADREIIDFATQFQRFADELAVWSGLASSSPETESVPTPAS